MSALLSNVDLTSIESKELDILVATVLGYEFYLERRGSGNNEDMACVLCKDEKPWHRVRLEFQEQTKERYEVVDSMKTIIKYGFWGSGVERYSSDWGVGGPLLEENQISLQHTEQGWVATKNNTTCISSNPLRAAMLCLVSNYIDSEHDD